MADDTPNISLKLLQQENARLVKRIEMDVKKTSDGGNGGSGGGETTFALEARLANVEGSIQGLSQSQNILGLLVGIVGAFVIGFGIYNLQRVDALTDKVGALPGQISSDMRDLTKTLAETITAAKQQPPQVILMPAPQLPDNGKH